MRFMMRYEAGREIDGPVASDGLQPSVKGGSRRISRKRPIVTDGPFAETKEFIAGGAGAQAESKEEAIESVKSSRDRTPSQMGDALRERFLAR